MNKRKSMGVFRFLAFPKMMVNIHKINAKKQNKNQNFNADRNVD